MQTCKIPSSQRKSGNRDQFSWPHNYDGTIHRKKTLLVILLWPRVSLNIAFIFLISRYKKKKTNEWVEKMCDTDIHICTNRIFFCFPFVLSTRHGMPSSEAPSSTCHTHLWANHHPNVLSSSAMGWSLMSCHPPRITRRLLLGAHHGAERMLMTQLRTMRGNRAVCKLYKNFGNDEILFHLG